MAKGLRSNRKKALRTLRRHDVKASSNYVEAENQRLASLHQTAEAGKLARETRAQEIVEQPMEYMETGASVETDANTDSMDIDKPLSARKLSKGIPVSNKKRMKAQKKKKADGIHALHRKKKKGKRK